MAKPDGRQLEQFVAFVEETLVPKGFGVKLNQKEFDEKGNQLAEFDIEVRGKVGTGEMAWLIECRDRPSEGAAPGSWIDQLVGRRSRFNFNKVTAVSTTGFSASAKDSAAKSGIELREVKSIAPKEFEWLVMEHLVHHERVHNLKHATINIVDESVSAEAKEDLVQILNESGNSIPFLTNPKEEKATIMSVFFNFTGQIDGLWDNMPANSAPIALRGLAEFKEDDRYHIETSHGTIWVGSILMEGEVFIRETFVAPDTFKYQDSETGNVISEIVKFSLPHADKQYAIEIHKVAGADTMPILLRRLGGDQED